MADTHTPSTGVNVAATDPMAPHDPAVAPQRLNRRQLVSRRFLRNRSAVVGLVGFVLVVLFALFGNVIGKWDYTQVDSTPSCRHPRPNTGSGPPRTGATSTP